MIRVPALRMPRGNSGALSGLFCLLAIALVVVAVTVQSLTAITVSLVGAGASVAGAVIAKRRGAPARRPQAPRAGRTPARTRKPSSPGNARRAPAKPAGSSGGGGGMCRKGSRCRTSIKTTETCDCRCGGRNHGTERADGKPPARQPQRTQPTRSQVKSRAFARQARHAKRANP